MLEHFVALVENKVFDVLEVQLLALDQGQDTAGGSHNHVRAVRLEHGLILGDGQTAEEYSNLLNKDEILVLLKSNHFIFKFVFVSVGE